MKTILALLVIMTLAVEAQSTTNAAPAKICSTNTNQLPVQTIQQSFTGLSQTPTQDFLFELPRPAKPNEILKGRITYSGSAVEIVKTKRPWQLLNPHAPPQYGSAEDNVARDPINGRVTGLKVFQIRF
jgi:hypothetical protein